MSRLSENFRRAEFACPCGCGADTVDAELIKILQKAREHFGARITISQGGGARCPEYQDRLIRRARKAGVTAGRKSLHLDGKAGDINVKGKRPREVADYFEVRYPKKYGVGRYKGHTHIDVRPWKARWGGDNSPSL